jgi:virginiamycin B lyase
MKLKWQSAVSEPVLVLYCVTMAVSSSPSLLAQAPTFVEYAVPTANSQPYDITSGPDKAIWFTEQVGNKIGRITTTGVLAEYALPAGITTPQGITSGPDGALWFSAGLKVCRITTSGVITLFSLPTAGFSPNFITPGPDGALWFTETVGRIGRVTTTGVITEYPLPTGSASGSIASGSDGALWFTQPGYSKIGRISTTGVVTSYPVSNIAAEIVAGPDGALWFTENGGLGGIGRLTTAGVLTEFPATSDAQSIVVGPDGALWYTKWSNSDIVRITTPGTTTVYPTQTASAEPWGITAGPDGALWFAERSINKIGRLLPAQSGFVCTNTTVPVISSIDSASAYGGYPYFASGSWLEIKGTNLADPADPRLTAATNPGQWTAADFTGSNAPTALDGVSVSINGKPAYIWYLSTGQLNVQAPEDTATGNVAIAVTNCKASSSPIMFARRTLAPGFLSPSNYAASGTQYLVATFASDGAYVLNTSTGASFGLNSRPAKPGDVIVAYGIGFGDVTPSILPGVIVGLSNALVNPIAVSFGSTPAALSYSGLAGSFVGLYEFYITVPSLANGDYQINVTQAGIAVPQTMYLTVHN